MSAVLLYLTMAQTCRENRLYFGEKNIPGMLAVLEPLHAILERGPQTLKETSFFQVLLGNETRHSLKITVLRMCRLHSPCFFQAYGNDLNEAKRWCQQYRVSLNTRDLNQAWDLYYHVFRRISRQVMALL